MSVKTPADDSGEGKVQGEGDYVAGRRFQDAEHAFVETGDVPEKAREAADALDGPEADDLEAARVSTGEGDIHGAKRRSSPTGTAPAAKPDADHTDHLRDRSLEDTFPASDPASTSPGAD